MSVQPDNTISRPTMSESVSNAPIEQLLRNLIDRIDADGLREDGAYQLLQQIALNTIVPRSYTKDVVVIDTSGIKTATKLIDCPPDKRIAVFDIYLSLNAATNVKFEYLDATDALGPMFAPNNGQGFVRNYPNGIVLKKGESLYYTNSANVSFGIEVNYALI